MEKKLAIEHHLIRPNEVIELLEMMGGKNKGNADGCSFLYYTLCTPKINNLNNEKVICGFTNLKMQNDYFAIFTLEKFWKKYPYKLNETVLCDDGLLGVITKMEWDCEKSDMKYHISFKTPVYNKWYSSKNIKYKFMKAKSKTLAIKAHPTSGKEVIELLEMLGGSNIYNLSGCNDCAYYVNDGHQNIIRGNEYIFGNEYMQYFTIEEFWRKYPYKVGDIVKTRKDEEGVIKQMRWVDNDIVYWVNSHKTCDWTETLSVDVLDKYNRLNLNDIEYSMETKVESTGFMQLGKTFAVIFNDANYEDEVELQLGDYEIVVRDGKTYAVLKKSKYPTTYAECCEVLVGRKPKPNEISFDKMEFCLVDLDNTQSIDFQTPYLSQLNSLFRLRICCDAYWKIYGEEMGLGKPWKPDWDNLSTNHEFIEIKKGCFTYSSRVLVFPIAEMRDAFYENFKDLIEQCKELL